MKTLAVFCLMVAGAYAAATVAALKHDGELFDKIDVKKILEDDKIRDAAIGCLLGVGECKGEHQYIKQVGPRLLATKCGDCTAAQKKQFDESIKYLEEHDVDLFKKVFEKFG